MGTPNLYSGRIKATHYVSELRLGGNCIASLRISDSLDHDFLELSGAVGGKMPIGPINFGLKAKIGFLDKDSSSQMEKTIEVTAVPSIEPKNPATLKEMFAAIENLPELIQLEPYYLENVFSTPPLKGVPISYVLSPISQLFSVSRIHSYIPFEKEVLVQIQDMLFTLMDFEVANSFRNLIREQESKLVYLFPTFTTVGANPWVQDVDNYQNMKQEIAIARRMSAMAAIQRYKNGQGDGIKDILEEIKLYQEEFDYVSILKMAEQLANEGREILDSVKPGEAMNCGIPKLFIFTQPELDSFIIGNGGYRLLLLTNGLTDRECYGQLYSTAADLADLGIEIRVACNNITDRACLQLKINSTIHEPYTGKRINLALTVLRHVASAKKKHYNTVTIHISTVASTRLNISLESLPLDDLGELVNYINNQIDHFQYPESFLQTVEQVKALSAEGLFSILCPLQYTSSTLDAIKYSAQASEALSQSNTIHKTIIASFEIGTAASDAPCLFVCNAVPDVVAICFDNLDAMILNFCMLSKKPFTLLGPEEMHKYTFYPTKCRVALDSTKLLNKDQEFASLWDQLINPFLIQPWTPEIDKVFSVAREVLSATCFSSFNTLVNIVARAREWKTMLDGTLVPTFIDHGWTDQLGFKKDCDFKALEEELALYLKDDEVILRIVRYAASPNRVIIRDVLKYFVDRLFTLLNNSHSILYGHIIREIEETMPDNITFTLLKACRLISLANYNPNFYTFWQSLESIRSLHDTKTLTDTLEKVANFSNLEQNWIWRNPKFNFWLDISKNKKEVLASIAQNFCVDEIIPDFIPPCLVSKLKTLFLKNKNISANVYFPTDWNTVEDMKRSIHLLAVQKTAPLNLTQVMTSNFGNNPDLQTALEKVESLYFWNELENRFTKLWSLKEILNAVTALMVNSLEPPTKRKIPSSFKPQRKDANANKFLNSNLSAIPKIPMESLITSLKTKMLPPILSRLLRGQLSIIDPKNVDALVKYPILKDRQGESLKTESDPFSFTKYLKYANCFPQERIISKFEYQPLPSDEGKHIEVPKYFLSRSCFLSLLLLYCDEAIITDLLSRLSQTSQFAIPLGCFKIMEKENNNSFSDYVDFSQFLPSKFDWHSTPCKKIICIRIGNCTIGKSTIINASLFKQSVFAQSHEPGSDNGMPIMRHGLAEVISLNSETMHPLFTQMQSQNEPAILVNVHGDFLNIPAKYIQSLSHDSAACMIFWNCSNWKEMNGLCMKLKESLRDDTPLFHVVLNPDTKLEKSNGKEVFLLDTKTDYGQKMRCFMESVISCSAQSLPNPTIIEESSPIGAMLQILEHYSVPNVRKTLSLQDIHGPVQVGCDTDSIISNPLWKECQFAYQEVLNLPYSQLQKLATRLLQLSDGKHLDNAQKLWNMISGNPEESAPFDKNSLREAMASELCKNKANTISILNFTAEMNTFYSIYPEAEGFLSYFDNLSANFRSGLPIPIHQTLDEIVQGILCTYENKVLVISVLDFSDSFETTKRFLASLFGSHHKFETTQQFHSSGSTARLIELDKIYQNQIKGILLIETTGLSWPVGMNAFEKNSICTHLISISHLVLITLGPTFSESSLQFVKNVIGVSLLSTCLLSAEKIVPDILFVKYGAKKDDTAHLQVEATIEQLFQELFSTMKNAFIQLGINRLAFVSLNKMYKRFINKTLCHILDSESGLGQDSDKLLELILKETKASEGILLSEFCNQWNELTNNNKFQKIHKNETMFQITAFLRQRDSLDKVQFNLEEAFLSHEFIIKSAATPEELEVQLQHLNKVPFMCPLSGCECVKSVTNLRQIISLDNSSNSEVSKLNEEIDTYSISLNNAIIEDITVEKSNQSHFLSWIELEIEMEYGKEMLEAIKSQVFLFFEEFAPSFDLRHENPKWSNSNFSIHLLTQGRMGWRKGTWLELRIEQAINRVVQRTTSFHRGMIRNLRIDVENIIENRFQAVFNIPEIFRPELIWASQIYGIIGFVGHWVQSKLYIQKYCSIHYVGVNLTR